MLNSEHPACATEATLNFVCDKQDTILLAYLLQRAQKSRRRNHETALTLHRLNNNGSYLVGGNLSHKHALKLRDAVFGGLLRRHIQTVGIWEWCVVYFRSEWAEAIFVGLYLGGHRHCHQRAAMKSIVKGDNRRAPCCIASNLDCVLDRFRAAVEKYGFFGEVSGGQLDNAFC